VQRRPDEGARVKVSQALNGSLLDPDPTIRADALEAVRIWVTRENASTLLKLLGNVRAEKTDSSARTSERIVQVMVSIGPEAQAAVVPLLKSSDGLLRRQACWILSEIGTSESVRPLEDAAKAFAEVDVAFSDYAQGAIAKITARK
jgi:hypothetical protein